MGGRERGCDWKKMMLVILTSPEGEKDKSKFGINGLHRSSIIMTFGCCSQQPNLRFLFYFIFFFWFCLFACFIYIFYIIFLPCSQSSSHLFSPFHYQVLEGGWKLWWLQRSGLWCWRSGVDLAKGGTKGRGWW